MAAVWWLFYGGSFLSVSERLRQLILEDCNYWWLWHPLLTYMVGNILFINSPSWLEAWLMSVRHFMTNLFFFSFFFSPQSAGRLFSGQGNILVEFLDYCAISRLYPAHKRFSGLLVLLVYYDPGNIFPCCLFPHLESHYSSYSVMWSVSSRCLVIINLGEGLIMHRVVQKTAIL